MSCAMTNRERRTKQDPLAPVRPEEFTAFVRLEVEKWTKVAKAGNIRVD